MYVQYAAQIHMQPVDATSGSVSLMLLVSQGFPTSKLH